MTTRLESQKQDRGIRRWKYCISRRTCNVRAICQTSRLVSKEC